MYGVLAVNKPVDWTSHDVCNLIKRKFKIKKVGHTGTLDPKATGVLVLLLGRFTKLASRFADDTKDYSGVLELGKKTSTQDAEGEIVEEKAWDYISESELMDVIASFKGKQKQIPPMASALKKNGVRLYKLARKGHEVEREPRDIEIFDIKCNKIDLPEIDFFVSVSKGTYVRTIANDIGEKLGTCAYLKSLCRVRSGNYSVGDALNVEDIKNFTEISQLLNYIKKDL